jgi:hypothetical protein
MVVFISVPMPISATMGTRNRGADGEHGGVQSCRRAVAGRPASLVSRLAKNPAAVLRQAQHERIPSRFQWIFPFALSLSKGGELRTD